MSIVTGTFSLTCEKCDKQHDFKSADADFEVTSTDERQMGTESCYSWNNTFNCDNCDNEIEVEYDVWEYPEGAYNNDDVRINGGEEVSRYSYDFHEPDDDY